MASRTRSAAIALVALAAAAGRADASAVNMTLSAPCAAAARALASSAGLATLCPPLLSVLGAPAAIGSCVAPSGSMAPLLNCRLPAALFNTTTLANASYPAPCPLCVPSWQACGGAVDVLVQAALGGPLAATCGAVASDVLTLTLLREQARVTCSAGSQPARLPGVMNLAGLTQCAACGLIGCPPGLYCPGGAAQPGICPAGSYCPGGAAKLVCPAGYYCPARSSAPLLCRSIASCPRGASREVVWVPLLVCLLLLVALAAGRHAAYRRMTGKRVCGGRSGGCCVRATAAAAARTTAVATTTRKALLSASRKQQHQQQQQQQQQQVDAAVGLDDSAAATDTAAAAGAHATGVAAPPRISVSFTDLRLTTRGNVRMDGVTGAIAAGRLTAIMGGSGAGKTTLSNLLLNKETPTSGSVAVTVAPPVDDPAAFAPFTTSIGAIRGGVGVVPQIDCMNRELTVRQIVAHSAFTRLPGGWSAARKAAHVDAVLHHMGLSHVAHHVVGDENARGLLSGGEVKATNIAIELAANPGLLFLDEPTTGLDATAAYRVMELLQLTAQRGITCAAVVHQPRAEILDMVDDLILLGRGGRPVYLGPMDGVVDYFRDVLGYACPPQENPSDFIMDVLEARFGAVKGAALAADGGGSATAAADKAAEAVDVVAPPPLPAAAVGDPTAPAAPDAGDGGGVEYVASSSAFLSALFAETWRTRGQAWVAARLAASGAAPAAEPAAAAADSPPLPPPARGALHAAVPRRPSFAAQTWRFTRRALVQHVLGGGLLLDACAFLLAGAVMGIVGVNGLYVPPVPTVYFYSCPPGAERLCKYQLRVALEPVTFYVSMALAVITIPAAVRSLGAERPVFWREASVGVNRLAYFVGKVAAEVPKMALLAFCFVAPLVAISHWRAPVERLFLSVFVDVFFLYALGFAVSATFVATDAANLFGVTVGVIMNLFSGFVPKLGEGGVWAFTRHFQRSLLAVELIYGWGLDPQTYDRSMFTKEHTNPDWGHDLWVLTVTALATYVLGFALLVLLYPSRQR